MTSREPLYELIRVSFTCISITSKIGHQAVIMCVVQGVLNKYLELSILLLQHFCIGIPGSTQLSVHTNERKQSW